MFPFEEDLVNLFIEQLSSKNSSFNVKRHTKEFYYNNGCTDILIENSQGFVLAFEAKLSKWRDALHQAYRNTAFAHHSYIIMPINKKDIVFANIHEFEKRGVGAVFVDNAGHSIAIKAKRNKILLPWLKDKAKSSFQE